MSNLQLLYPEILLSVFAVILFLADLWIPERHGKILYHLGGISAALVLSMLGISYSNPANFQGLGSLWVVDPMSLFFKVLILLVTILVILLSLDYLPDSGSNPHPIKHLGSFSALILISSAGMMLLVSAVDLLLIFLALETISISSFILSGFERSNRKSSEGAIKYFLIGSFSAAIMIYGISLFYGATGTTSLLNLSSVHPSGMFILGVLLLVVGFGFKASVVPFHLWVPDAYEGAPTPVTAYLSVAPKVAALAAMLRVFTQLLPASGDMIQIFAFLSALTMTVGNLTAIFQNNVKRLLAYSSIAQAGYMLIAFVAGAMGRDALLLYALVYVFMNIGAFTVAIMIGNEDSYELEAYDGLATRSFGVALLMAFFLLSLAGVPPLGGFIAKFYVFAAAMQAKYYWLAVVGVLNSVVSAFYYLRIVYHMFFMPAQKPQPLRAGVYLYSGLAIAAIAIFWIGLYPEPFIASIKVSSQILPQPAAVSLLTH